MIFQKLPDGWTTSKLLGFNVYHSNNDVLVRRIKQDGSYESEGVQLITAKSKNGSVGFDVGANIGLFSLSVLANSSVNSEIFAFEPNPKTFAKLACTIARNSLGTTIKALPVALSNSTGAATFTVHRERSSSGDGFLDTGRAGEAGTIVVPTITLDEIAHHLQLVRLDWLKIDVEGAELWVLEGATKVLKEFEPLIYFEAYSDNIAPYRIVPDELFLFLKKRGFAIGTPNDRNLTLAEFRTVVQKREVYNFVAHKKSPSEKDA